MESKQTVEFRHTDYMLAFVFIIPLAGIVFAINAYAYDKFTFHYGIEIYYGFFIPVILTLIIVFFVYEKLLRRFVEKTETAYIYNDRVDLCFHFSKKTILFEDISSVEYKLCKGFGYALVIKTKQGKISINEIEDNRIRKNDNSELVKLFEILSSKI
jgi:hypothetical protein